MGTQAGHRRRGLMGRHVWRTVRGAYEKQRVEGRLPVTFEVVHGHAWKAEPANWLISHQDRSIPKQYRPQKGQERWLRRSGICVRRGQL